MTSISTLKSDVIVIPKFRFIRTIGFIDLVKKNGFARRKVSSQEADHTQTVMGILVKYCKENLALGAFNRFGLSSLVKQLCFVMTSNRTLRPERRRSVIKLG